MSAIIGQAPQYIDAFADFSGGWSTMVPSAQWSAWSQKQSPVAQSLTPIIAVPLATYADHGLGTLQQVANGAHDDVYRGVATAYRDNGFSTIDIRIGWEMDGDYMPWSMGTTSASAAIWKAAFSHVADVLHSIPGIKINVIWNPAMSNNNSVDVRETYPGDDKVDIVGLDLYSHNYKADQSISDYQYFMYPSATASKPVGDPVSQWGLVQTMEFAAAHNKPVGIAETGVAVGDTNTLPSVIQAAFNLPGAPAAAFVTVWDVTTPEGDWKFTDGNNPGAAAAWAAAFAQGRSGTVTTQTTAAPAATSTLKLSLSEDAFQGDAQFTVSVDGVQQGGAQSVTASHAAGASQFFTFTGNWTGAHTVAVSFLNDAWGGSTAYDRNLYVNSITLNGVTNANTAAIIGSTGTKSFPVSDAASATNSSMVLHMSEDAYAGDAQFTISVDGTQQGGVQTVRAWHGVGDTQDFTVGSFAAGSHSVTVNFLNDAWGGTALLDRNLYVDSIDFGGTANLGAHAVLGASGPQTLTVTSDLAAATAAAVNQTVVANLSQDAYQGNAQFLITLDGKALNSATQVGTLHASGLSQAFAYSGQFGVGPHDLAISFVNDAWGGTASTDRNLYVNSIDFNGHHYTSSATLGTNSTQHFQIGVAGQL